MPALALPAALSGTNSDPVNASNLASSSSLTNATGQVFRVVCAWPVSGQYGPGSRILYYVLVAACVFGRQTVWLRDACLAAALLLPAVAALHGIVLAAVHVDGAVDMDVYGAFQLCAIGVLAGPATVRWSQTYFNNPGRNMIFVWTGIILAGLLSLTVEFYRASPTQCAASQFSWGEGDRCGLTCSTESGPSSPLRGGAQNNIYVIKEPNIFTFGTATLLSAACCIPAILSMASMWTKILEINWKRLWGREKESNEHDHRISGTTNGNPARMKNINEMIRFYLTMVEVPLLVAAVLAILVIGERNFFSYRVWYMTEPIASVGQWAPIVGTGLAALGSFYNLLASWQNKPDSTMPKSQDPGTINVESGRNSSAEHHGEVELQESVSRPQGLGISAQDHFPSITLVESCEQRSRRDTHETLDLNENQLERFNTAKTSWTVDVGSTSRVKVAEALEWVGNKLGTPAPDAFGNSSFRSGPAAGFPTVPAEEQRNPELTRTKEKYRQRSRTGSFAGSTASGFGITNLPPTEQGRRANSVGADSTSVERDQPRRDTLTVPEQVYHSPVPRRDSSFASSSRAVDSRDGNQRSPSIRISSEASSSAYIPNGRLSN